MTTQICAFAGKGVLASRLRQRKYALVRKFGLPDNLVGGSLSLNHRRCGKPNCRCVGGRGHGQWAVTFRHLGKKRVERVPEEWLADLEKEVLATQAYLDAMKEVMAINIELLSLTRAQFQEKKKKAKKKSR